MAVTAFGLASYGFGHFRGSPRGLGRNDEPKERWYGAFFTVVNA
jgi:hypothetical protein